MGEKKTSEELERIASDLAMALAVCLPRSAGEMKTPEGKTLKLVFQTVPEDSFDSYIKTFAQMPADRIPDGQLDVLKAARILVNNPDYVPEPYSLDGIKAGLAAAMEDYAVTSIVEGKSIADWHKKLQQIVKFDQALAVRITTNFRNYEEAGPTDPTPKVTLARIAMRADEPLLVLAQPEGVRQVLLEQMGQTEEDLKDLVLDEMEMFAVYAQKTGEFGKEWHRIVNAVAQRDPVLAAEATRYTIDPLSIASPDNDRDRVAACHIAQALAIALKDAGYHHNAAKLVKRLLDRANEGFDYLGPDTKEKAQALYDNVLSEWQAGVDAIPDNDLRQFAQGIIDQFKAPQKPDQPAPPSPGPAPGGFA